MNRAVQYSKSNVNIFSKLSQHHYISRESDNVVGLSIGLDRRYLCPKLVIEHSYCSVNINRRIAMLC